MGLDIAAQTVSGRLTRVLIWESLLRLFLQTCKDSLCSETPAVGRWVLEDQPPCHGAGLQ